MDLKDVRRWILDQKIIIMCQESRIFLRTLVYTDRWMVVLFIKIGNNQRLCPGVEIKILTLYMLNLKFYFGMQNVK